MKTTLIVAITVKSAKHKAKSLGIDSRNWQWVSNLSDLKGTCKLTHDAVILKNSRLLDEYGEIEKDIKERGLEIDYIR